MPSVRTDTMDARIRFVCAALQRQGRQTMASLCQEYGIAR